MSETSERNRAPATRSHACRVVYFIAYPQRMAGANRSLFELVTNLPEGFRSVVVSVGEGRVTEAYRAAGVEVVLAEPGPRLSQFGKVALGWTAATQSSVLLRELLPYTFRLRSLFRELRPALLHTNDPRGTLMAGLAAKSLRIPIVTHLRGEIPFRGLLSRVYESIPDRFVAVSEATRMELSEAARRRAVAVYNGTRDVGGEGPGVPWLDALRRRGVTVVSMFASVVPFKGVHHLLRAASELVQEGLGDHFVVVCVGDLDSDHPAYVDWALNLRDELKVQNVTFAGWQDDPFRFYRSSDLSVLPSVSEETLDYGEGDVLVRGNEGFPRTHLEAMCFGLPIVGTDIAGVREQVVDGETGIVVPPSNSQSLADAIRRLVEDAGLREEMGARGRERVLRLFSTPAYVSGVVAVYDDLNLRTRSQ